MNITSTVSGTDRTTDRTTGHTAPANTTPRLGAPASARWYALGLAFTLTLATLASVDKLAQVDRAVPQYAQASSPRA